MLATGDIVLVAFPYAESDNVKYRPALVVSTTSFHKRFSLCWVVMITSADNEQWDGDIALAPLREAGINKDSLIRVAKMATISINKVEKIGKVSAAIRRAALNGIRDQLEI